MTDRDGDWGDLSQLVKTGYHYAHAPIAEAILQLSVALPPDVTLANLAAMMTEESDYPLARTQITVEGQFEVVEDDVRTSSSAREVGYMWARDDEARVVQAHLDRFVFSWLAPYTHWDAFLAEAEQMWLRFRRVARPTYVLGIGVRFVNKINVDSPAIEIKDYLRTSIDVSPYLPQVISSLFMQVDVPLHRHKAVATITSMLTPPPVEGQTTLVLDIDAKRDVSMEIMNDTFEADLKECLATLRDAKNFVFEACITDATRRLIS